MQYVRIPGTELRVSRICLGTMTFGSPVGEEDAIRKAYIEIGKLYYAERGMAAEPAYVALCERITAAKINIEENKNRIAELKQEGNISDDEAASYVETNVPPEEPVGGEDAPHSEEIPPQE